MKSLLIRIKRTLVKSMAALILLTGVTTAYAEDLWGCEVMLCLSNPGGPTEFNECKPPIEKLWKHLAKGHSFPSCTQANGNDPSKNYVRQTYDAFDPCSLKGLKDAPIGYVAEGTRKEGASKTRRDSSSNYVLTKSPVYNTGVTTSSYNPRNQDSPTSKMCVGNQTGAYTVSTRSGGDNETYSVIVFDKVLRQKAQSPRAIDVYIDGKLFNRVHW